MTGKRLSLFWIISVIIGFVHFFSHQAFGQESANEYDYVVQKGDTLTSIIVLKYRAHGLKVHMYGPDGMLEKMARLNGDVVTDPHKIFPGTKIKYPQEMSEVFQEVAELTQDSALTEEAPLNTRPAKRTAAKVQAEAENIEQTAAAQRPPIRGDILIQEEGEYTVQEGDSLTSIIILKYRALGLKVRMYGPDGMLEKITQLNSDAVTDPHKIFPGTKIKYPQEMLEVFAAAKAGRRAPASTKNKTN